MKKTILILFFLMGMGFGYSQSYSTKKIEKRIIELTKRATDTVYFNYESGKKLDKPKLEFWVNDNLTGNVFSSDPNYSDNEMYSMFQKLLNKGKLSDFEKMSKNNNPSIRIYGFWALVKNKKYVLAEKIMQLEKSKNDTIIWNSVGCVVEQKLPFNLMKKIIENMKKYGN